MTENDNHVINDFGDEWNKFTYVDAEKSELQQIFSDYFDIVNKNNIELMGSTAFDFGAGSGRWSRFLSDMTQHLVVIEPSSAIDVARRALCDKKNVSFEKKSFGDYDGPWENYDFGICLGVIHHVNDTLAAMKVLHRMLKNDGHCLVYVYSDLSQHSFVYRGIWFCSNIIRNIVSKLPMSLKAKVCDFLAFIAYLPLSRLAKLISQIPFLKDGVKYLPLNYYKDKSFYVMRTDSLDRFGTKLEKRYSQSSIKLLAEEAGFQEIKFSNVKPYWVFLLKK
jgi:2-polyprenyl-3-methyl-5-hydroxy-6-metoxy-1,4-benzoquinol methylase